MKNKDTVVMECKFKGLTLEIKPILDVKIKVKKR